MRVTALVVSVLLLSTGVAARQSDVNPIGVATVGGIEIAYRCTPVPEGAQRFYAEVFYVNSDLVRPPDLPATTIELPGLIAQASATSSGSGRSTPFGSITFRSRWFGHPGFIIAAERDVFTTSDGDIYADELFTRLPGTEAPNMTWLGDFTFTGGTGRYERVSGSATGVAQQTGDGTHSVLVACGWMSGIENRR